jgi:hypothetical protein
VAHEGGHALRWQPSHEETQVNPKTKKREQTPEAIRQIKEDEGHAYASSIRARRQLGLQTDERWLDAHPGVEQDPSNPFKASAALRHPTVKDLVDEIRKGGGTYPKLMPTRIQKIRIIRVPGSDQRVRPRDEGRARALGDKKGMAD